LRGDILIREYLTKTLKGFYIAGVDIERGENSFKIVIKSSRPGMIIGRSGEGMTKLKNGVLKFMAKNKIGKPDEFKIDVEEVKSPDSNAAIVAAMVVEGLEKRFPFRRVMKQTAEKVMACRDVKGVRILLSGRLGGAEMSRKEQVKKGGIPLQTFRADIDYKKDTARLPYGGLGVKVWIYKGEVFEGDKK